jgi:hypothetical protein
MNIEIYIVIIEIDNRVLSAFKYLENAKEFSESCEVVTRIEKIYLK